MEGKRIGCRFILVEEKKNYNADHITKIEEGTRKHDGLADRTEHTHCFDLKPCVVVLIVLNL